MRLQLRRLRHARTPTSRSRCTWTTNSRMASRYLRCPPLTSPLDITGTQRRRCARSDKMECTLRSLLESRAARAVTLGANPTEIRTAAGCSSRYGTPCALTRKEYNNIAAIRPRLRMKRGVFGSMRFLSSQAAIGTATTVVCTLAGTTQLGRSAASTWSSRRAITSSSDSGRAHRIRLFRIHSVWALTITARSGL